MSDALSFIGSLDTLSLIELFWFAVLFEVPRYGLGALIIILAGMGARPQAKACANKDASLSILLAGHNEAASLRRCIEALGEQTLAQGKNPNWQIVVVDDGSTDNMSDIARALQKEGRVDEVLKLSQRGGKSAAINLAFSVCTGDIIIISDIDTTLDRDALERLLPYFDDPRVGAVGGTLEVRNAEASLVTRHQAIEYALSIGLGRRLSDLFGTLSIVSGAFGAFRRSAVEAVGGQDVEVGEDADLTMKLRRAGWRVTFAPDARALTNVPETIVDLIAQRLRWDRGLVTIWSRKFRGEFNPASSSFRLSNVVALADILFFQIVLTLVFPAYLVWLWLSLGAMALPVFAATLIGYALMDGLLFMGAAFAGIGGAGRLIAYLPFYSLMQVTVMRAVRLFSIIQELVFRSSYRDPYVPGRVMDQVERV